MIPFTVFFLYPLYRFVNRLLKVNGKIMKYIIPCLILIIAACDFMILKTTEQQTCKEIAVNRLKHPRSFDFISVTEKEVDRGQIEINLNFTAWNDFKVPMLHTISCRFQGRDFHELLFVRWNGRLIRHHELDDIRGNMP